jgi:hypothetical protein
MRVEFIGSLSAISKYFVMEIVDDDFEVDESRYEDSNLSVFFTSRCFDAGGWFSNRGRGNP